MPPPPHTHLPTLIPLPEAGGRHTAYAYVAAVSEGKTRAGAPYVDLELADAEGRVAAKVWSDNARLLEAARAVRKGDAVKALFEVGEYQGTPQLTLHGLRPVDDEDRDYDADTVFGEGFAAIADLRCRTLVFDIETVPAQDTRSLPPMVAQAVAKSADRSDMDEGKVMSLSPWFSKVVSLAFGEGEHAGDPAKQPVTALVVPPAGVDLDGLPPWIRPMSEAGLLRAFWHLATHAELVVTFNGQGFDVPFLVARSLVHGIPARVDLLGHRWKLRPHLDLLQVLGQGGRGPTSLDVVCWALGVTSPKGVMDGSMVAPTYARGDIATIATYNAGDVRATAEVYRRTRDRVLRFRSDF